MATQLFDSTIVASPEQALDFIGNILESSTEYSIIGKDLEGKILLWNEGARRLYGYEPEEVVGKANSSILHTAEDVQAGKPHQILETALRDGKWEGTIRRVRKDGQQFVARVVITPRRDASGRPIGFLLISKDISDEIRLTEQLKATQFYTRSLIESNIDALMTTDPLGIITDVNQQMEALTGCSREELIGYPVQELLHRPAAGRGRHPPGAARGQGHQLRADGVHQGRQADRRLLQRDHVLRPRRQAAGGLRGRARRDRAEAVRAGAAGEEHRAGERQPGQGPLPGQHVPRAAHAAQRHHRLHRHPADEAARAR